MPSTHLFRTLALACGLLFGFSSCQKTTPASEHVPKVYADSSRTITLPLDSVRLNGSATDTGGKVVAWLWSEVSGPNVPIIQTEGSPSTTISGLIAGTYVFQLMVLDSAGETGVGMVTIIVNPSIVKGPGSVTLYSDTTGGGFFEMHYMGNSIHDASDRTAPEMDAFTWTVNGEVFYGRAAFRFNIPAGTPVKSAKLSLYSNYSALNGDHLHANYGSSNAFYISRVNSTWNPATTTWATQPGIDSTGQVLIPQTNSPFLDLVDIDVTTMVNTMIASGNYGFKIQLQNESIYNSRDFYSSRVADSTKRPKLVVTY